MREGKFEVLPCVIREPPDTGVVVEDNRGRCREHWFLFDRDSLNTTITVFKSEDDCRRGEVKRLDESDGWDPLVVVLVGVGIVVLAAGAAFVAGYAAGAR